jgi:uncharacterized protein
MFNVNEIISEDTEINLNVVCNVVDLINEGATIPFIARYRKDSTDNLDEVGVKAISDKLTYYNELEDRKKTVLETIDKAGKLTLELKNKIEDTRLKTELEDLYLPYKPKRRTRATIARELGLEPLAKLIYEQKVFSGDKADFLKPYFSEEKELLDSGKILQGAMDIIAEWINEIPEVRDIIRNEFREEGSICSRVVTAKKEEKTKFEMYYDFKEKIKDIPSHRILGMRRGEKEKTLLLSFEIGNEKNIELVKEFIIKNEENLFLQELNAAVEDGYKRLLRPGIETEMRMELKEKADEEAIKVFSENLRNVLLAAPLGSKEILAIDPGIRTGSKTVVLSENGDFLYDTVLYTRNEKEIQRSMSKLIELLQKYKMNYIAVGNGTGGRDIQKLIDKTLKENGMKNVYTLLVNESGASVYSASEIAREEFPELDLTLRGAISIGRRLQDPLSESVKIEPKSIGVGQYQHDVDQKMLSKELDHVVSSCVNYVGVDLNTASFSLLQYVSGITKKTAKNIVEFRKTNNGFKNRQQLLEVSGLGAKAFQQAAGFLRIRNSENKLDNSAVHPENYEVVNRIAKFLETDISNLLEKEELLEKIDKKQFLNDEIGEYTLEDILEELKKPGRDPRNVFENPNFRDDVNTVSDLKMNMILEGVVTNITRFGAFVDIGVHQDGLLHISEISDKYVGDLTKILKVGMKIKVEVIKIESENKRISLSKKFDKDFIKSDKPMIIRNTKKMKYKSENVKKKNDTGNPFLDLLGSGKFK